MANILDSVKDDEGRRPTIKAADLLSRMKEGYQKDGEDEDEEPKQSWFALIRQQQAAQAKKKEAEKKARAARLARLFDDDALESDDDMLDANAASKKVDHFLNKIDTHLKVERQLLENWQDQDQKEKE